MKNPKGWGTLCLFAIVSLALVSVLAGCGTSEPPATAQKYKYMCYQPNNQVYEYKWQEWFAQELTKATNGLMTFEMSVGGQLGYPANKYLEVTGQGLVDFANTMDANESGNMPEFVIGSLPMLFKDYTEFEKYRQRMEPQLAKYLLDKWNVVLVASAPMMDQSLITTKPVRKLEDLKGMKIRVLTEAEGNFFKAVGAVPVTMQYAELYSGFQRGVIDGMTFYTYGLYDMKFAEVTKYVPIRSVRATWDLVVVNKDKYDKMPSLFKKALADLKDPYLKHALNDLPTLWEKCKQLGAQQGVDFTLLPDSELQKATALAIPLWTEYANKYGPLAQEALKVAREVTGR
jgi:TRAP-type C4-dicarboxylate transport system substrate-binding protein